MVAPVAVDVFLLAGRFPGTDDAAALRHALAYGAAAEAAGFGGAWVAEHHFIPYGVIPSATAFAGHLLGRTRTLRVGTAACLLSVRHPVALAEEAVLLDELSGGRFDLGVARGGPWVDLEVFGAGDAGYAPAGFAEALDVLGAWLSGRARVGGAGPRFAFRPVDVVPRPRRPVGTWVAATSAGTAALAAARGLPLLLGLHAPAAAHAELLAGWAAAARAHGHDPAGAPHAAAHLAYVADSRDEAVAAVRAALPGWVATTGAYVRLDGEQGGSRDPAGYAERLLDLHPVGPPAYCVEVLRRSLAVSGARRLLLLVEAAGDPALTLANIARLGAEVLPALR
ncbi:alkanal monooxygenase [Pilimelia anulata]|uniref:Alkanal monooxygenase n=1 Tax=Pilimelia anulata TaxID=53371 RepID=A0A8J3BAM5_9ACTN|nr:LLM class flavin-dependent oxidoreductase [Pilimelia anulata]GGJ90849.1 alkanal monooxygenase [Pilimelia anulata]